MRFAFRTAILDYLEWATYPEQERNNHIWLLGSNNRPQRYKIVKVTKKERDEHITEFSVQLRPVSANGLWAMPDDPMDMSSWSNPEQESDEAKSPIPKPSTTPPMWAKDVGRSRRPRGHNRGGSRLQWGQR